MSVGLAVRCDQQPMRVRQRSDASCFGQSADRGNVWASTGSSSRGRAVDYGPRVPLSIRISLYYVNTFRRPRVAFVGWRAQTPESRAKRIS